MKQLSDLTKQAGEWLRGAGPMSEIVISSRMRLARNVAGFPFLSRSSTQECEEVGRLLRETILSGSFGSKLFFVDVDAAPNLDRQLLMERHLISKQHAEGKGCRGVAVSSDETVAMMVNEEDHLRIQVLRSGLQMEEAFEQINGIDDLLEEKINYSFSPRFGYLTACPTNVGTGIRVSVMLHLPALKLTGEIERVFRAAKDMRLAVRGLYGEGTEAMGDFYQVSNQSTLGKSEREIVDDFQHVVIPKIIEYEHQARRILLNERTTMLDDKVHRALGILRAARMISSEETMHLLSHVRMGVNLGRVKELPIQTMNELFLVTQPAHLQRIYRKRMDAKQRSVTRADLIRRRLGEA